MELNGLYSLDGKLKFKEDGRWKMDEDGKFDTEDNIMYRNQHGAMLYFDDGKWKIAMIEGTDTRRPARSTAARSTAVVIFTRRTRAPRKGHRR